jgi:dihydrolipoamide dehydrogenase
VVLDIESVADSKKDKLDVDIVLVSVGRRPFTENLGLESVGIKPDERGKVPVNDHFQTNESNIYAIGDIIRGPMLAHKAEEEGVAVAEIIAGEHGHVNYDAIPGVVYTFPEVASVGKTEDQVKQEGIEYKIGKFPFLANSRARANGDTDGFVKIIACKKTDRILGAHIIGANAGELIQELVLGMEYKASAEDIARTSHGHPGLSEAVKEAALATFFKPLHM